MAKTVSEWKKIITDVFISSDAIKSVYQLEDGKTFEDEFSVSSIESIIFYCVAYCTFVLDKLFDLFRTEVNETISSKKPHTLKWYAEKAEAFQLGFNLLPDSDLYNNAAATTEQIEASKVVKYAAATRASRQSGRVYLRIKIAGETNNDLSTVSDDVANKVGEYFSRIADAGVDYEITNRSADRIYQQWTIFYNPLLYDDKGQRPDGSKPIENAIKTYLKQLPFNGTYVPTYHIDAVQKVEGVVVPILNSCNVQWGGVNVKNITDTYIPDAGYLRFYDPENDLKIEYQPHSPIL